MATKKKALGKRASKRKTKQQRRADGARPLCKHLEPLLVAACADGNEIVTARWEPIVRRLRVALRLPKTLEALRGGLELPSCVDELETIGTFGYLCEACGDSLQAPRPPAEAAFDDKPDSSLSVVVERLNDDPLR